MAGSFLIYALVDPRTKAVHYIGKSSTGLKRPGSHGAAKRIVRDFTLKGAWIRALRAEGVTYGVEVLERVEMVGRLEEAERRWITHGRAEGWPLTNMTDGGDGAGGFKMSEEQRQRMRDAWATGQRRHTPETIEKLRALKKGIPRTEEVKAKLRVKNLGRTHSLEAREKMSQSRKGKAPGNKGMKMSVETRAKQSAALRGRVFTAEHRAKIAASKRGKPRPDVTARNRSPEQRVALSRATAGRKRPDLAARNKTLAQRDALSRKLTGRTFSPATIERMRQTQRRRHSKLSTDT